MARGARLVERRPTVVGYIRVSTAEQADSGLGLKAQQDAIAHEAARRGWEIARTYEDAGASAKALSGRPGLSDALSALAAGEASVLVVSKLDRLARSVADFAHLVRRAEREGWALVCVDLGVDMSTPTGGLLANVTASVAEWERRIIAQRTKDALAAKRAQGGSIGRPVSLPDEVANRIVAARTAGRSWPSIADELNADGVPTAQGGSKWWPATVRKVALRAAANRWPSYAQ